MVRKIAGWLHQERGIALVESLVALAILGTTLVTLIIALATGSIAIRETDEEMVVQSLARTQLEYIKGYTYDSGATSYPAVAAPPGYAISVGVSAIPGTNTDIQKISANITRAGVLVLTIEDYKVNR